MLDLKKKSLQQQDSAITEKFQKQMVDLDAMRKAACNREIESMKTLKDIQQKQQELSQLLSHNQDQSQYIQQQKNKLQAEQYELAQKQLILQEKQDNIPLNEQDTNKNELNQIQK